MVTAILPTIVVESKKKQTDDSETNGEARGEAVASDDAQPAPISKTQSLSGIAASQRSASGAPRLAGLVGFFTGCGALLALLLFLPLPARFSQFEGITQAQAVADSFYVVGCIALLVSVSCLIGLRHLPGEDHKGWGALLGRKTSSTSHKEQNLPMWKLLKEATLLAFKDVNIGLGYLGGFVARASSVGMFSCFGWMHF